MKGVKVNFWLFIIDEMGYMHAGYFARILATFAYLNVHGIGGIVQFLNHGILELELWNGYESAVLSSLYITQAYIEYISV